MKELNYRALYARQSECKDRINEICDAVEKEQREFSEAENKEMTALQRELSVIEGRISASKVQVNVGKTEQLREATQQLREAMKAGQRFEMKISRDINTSTYAQGLAGTNPSGLTTGEVVKALYPTNILSAIGSPLITGVKGNYQFPVVETFEASIEGEAVELGDTAVNVSKLIAKPERLAVAVPVTREAINETDGLLEKVVLEDAPKAIGALMNKVMFSTEKVTGATNLVGPFVGDVATNEYTGDITMKDLTALKGAVLSNNIVAEQLCYVMSETTKALLEATPQWEGAAQPIVDENGKIAGVPVYTTPYAGEGTVLFGSWKYAPQCIFGDISIIVDPYTKARNNAVDFVVNVDYAITTLRSEAFAKLVKAGE